MHAPLRRGAWIAKYPPLHTTFKFITKFISPARLKWIGLFGLAMTLLLPGAHAYGENSAITNPLPQFELTREATIIGRADGMVKITPGDSNTTLEVRRKQEELARLWRSRAANAGLALRELSHDEMIEAIEQFLGRSGSPMTANAADFVEISEQYSIDPRLLVGVAGAESSLGLHMLPGSHNPFGLGPHRYFATFRDAIEAEAQFLHHYFISRGVTSPHSIGPSYTGTGSTSWGVNVARFMGQI